MLDRLTAFLSLAIAVAVYFISRFNIWITIIAIVACALIFRSLRTMFQPQLERIFPPLTVYYLSGQDLSSTASGLRVIIITEKIFFHTEVEADKNFLLDYINEYAAKLSESSRIFKYRYSYVQKRNLPYQAAYAACRNAKTSLKVVYKKWFDTSGVSKFGKFEEDIDSFSVDDIIIDPRDGSEHRSMIQFIFDPNLPVPDEHYQ